MSGGGELLQVFVGSLVKPTLVLLAAALLALALQRISAAARHAVWSIALIGLVALPVFTAVLPPIALALLPATTPVHVAIDNAPAAFVQPPKPGPLGAGPAAVAAEPASSAAWKPARSFNAGSAVALLAWCGTALLLVRLAVGLALLAVTTRRARAFRGTVALEGTASGICRRPPQVLVSPDIQVPITWGVIRPVVLLPQDAATWPPHRLRQAWLHETAHVKRADWAVQVLVQVACALYWFHPLVWLAARRQRLAGEQACDDCVLGCGAPCEDYAEQLLELGRRPRSTSPGAVRGALAMARERGLAVRIRAVLDRKTRRSPMSRTSKITLALAAVLPLLLVAMAQPVTGAGDRRAGETVLSEAIVAGDVPQVARLIAAGADVNAIDRPGRGECRRRTPLGTAACTGQVEIVRLLLDAGANVDAVPRGDGSALMIAAEQGHRAVVEELIEHGADVDVVSRGDGTALIKAANGGRTEIVDLLLRSGADPNIVVRGDGSPLIGAARSGDSESVRRLLDAGADPDEPVPGDENPLFHAVASNDLDSVRSLIAAGADVNVALQGDGTPLMVASRQGLDDIAAALLAAGARVDTAVPGDGTALIGAAATGNVELARRLLDAGADIDAGVLGDGNPLSMAARYGHLDMVRVLVERGADIEKVVPGDENPLIQAAAHGQYDVAEYLINRGADVNARVRAHDGVRTPLNQALRYGHAEVADLLRRHGAVE